MRIAVIGAGPAGLFFALLAKRRRPDAQIAVFEQNTRDATFGFGVVFSHGALDILRRDAPAMLERIDHAMESWPMQRIVHRDTAVDIDGNGFCAIERLTLLRLLQAECEAAGVALHFDATVSGLDRFGDCDLVVGADGVNSFVRRQHAATFAPSVEWLTNRFAWYGTTKSFECLTLTFRQSEHGTFVAHHYRYAPDRSTFIVECDAATWSRAGLDRMDDAASRTYCEGVFDADLEGHPLVSNRSVWRNFPLLANRRWHAHNCVLIGDALRTGHFSIGSGTRLAFDDAIALDRASAEAGDDVPTLLHAFERERRPVVDKLVAAANASSYWYERMADRMAQSPIALAYDYMTRSGRMTDARLTQSAPRFMAAVQAARREADPALASTRHHVIDPVPRASAGSAEIGYAVPERYNAAELLYRNRERNPEKVAIVCGDERLTYGELCALADRVGEGLTAFGLARGGRVLMLLDDGHEYVAAIFGAIRAGFVPVLVNTLSPAELVAYYLHDSGAEVACVDEAFVASLQHESAMSSRLRHVVCVGAAAQPSERPRWHAWSQWIAQQSGAFTGTDTHRDEMAFWMYSSGSTGRPKGVVHLQHDALYTCIAYAGDVIGMRPDDIVFSPPKIFFAYGFGNSVTFPCFFGATAVLMPGRPEPERVFATIERHRPTLLFGLPTLYTALHTSAGAERRNLSSLRMCLSAAETLSAELSDAWRERYGLAIVEGLGSTEVLHIYLSNTPQRQQRGASGRRVPGYELRLTDPDGRGVREGESGVLWVRGDSQAPCYWNRPDKTAETMREGWIHTGDRFRVDADGFYFFEGRVDDLVKVSGQWVHPVEVERCLSEHPLVRECAVLAIDDARKLKTIAAFVALRDPAGACDATTRALQAFVRERLVPYKYPRVVHYLDELPKTGTGKVDRQALQALRAHGATPN